MPPDRARRRPGRVVRRTEFRYRPVGQPGLRDHPGDSLQLTLGNSPNGEISSAQGAAHPSVGGFALFPPEVIDHEMQLRHLPTDAERGRELCAAAPAGRTRTRARPPRRVRDAHPISPASCDRAHRGLTARIPTSLLPPSASCNRAIWSPASALVRSTHATTPAMKGVRAASARN